MSTLDKSATQRYSIETNGNSLGVTDYSIKIPKGNSTLNGAELQHYDHVLFNSNSKHRLIDIINKAEKLYWMTKDKNLSPLTLELGTYTGRDGRYGLNVWKCVFHSPNESSAYLIFTSEQESSENDEMFATPRVVCVDAQVIPIILDLLRQVGRE